MKNLSTAFMLLTTSVLYSQGYFGMSGNNKGIGFHLGGMIAEKVDVHTTFTHRIKSDRSIPMTWSLNAGPVLGLWINDYHKLILSPYAGISYVSKEDISKVNEPPLYAITKEKGTYFNYGGVLEIKGGEVSFFLGANKNKYLYVSFGTKFYPFSD